MAVRMTRPDPLPNIINKEENEMKLKWIIGTWLKDVGERTNRPALKRIGYLIRGWVS